MPTCPYCQSSISEEIQQFGGECSNCFRFIEGNFNEQEEFEPTGMFTREQLSQFLEDANPSEDFPKESTDDLTLEELEVDDIEFDEVTELLEPTDPIVEDVVEDEEITPAKTLAVEEDDFDFDDEPTVALTAEQMTGEEYLESDELGVVENEPFESVEHQAPALDIVERNNEPVSDVENSEDRDYVFDEESEESFLADDEPIHEELEVPMDIPPVISPKDEREVRSQTTDSSTKSNKFLIGPIVFGLSLVGIVVAMMLPKEETVVEEVAVEQQELFVPEVTTGSLEQPEEVDVQKTVQKTTTVQRKKKNEPEIVDRGGVRTFKTAAPVSRTPTAATLGTQTSGSVQKDLPNLQKSLQYCHTTALKTDPTASGKWQVSFTVSSKGDATGILIKPLRRKNSQIESCMKKKIQRFNFHNDGGSTPVKFRVVFGG